MAIEDLTKAFRSINIKDQDGKLVPYSKQDNGPFKTNDAKIATLFRFIDLRWIEFFLRVFVMCVCFFLTLVSPAFFISAISLAISLLAGAVLVSYGAWWDPSLQGVFMARPGVPKNIVIQELE